MFLPKHSREPDLLRLDGSGLDTTSSAESTEFVLHQPLVAREEQVQFRAVNQSSAPSPTVLLLLLLFIFLLRLCSARAVPFLLLGPHGSVQTSLQQQQLLVSEHMREERVTQSEAT